MREINQRWRLTNSLQSRIVEICQQDICEIKSIVAYIAEGLQNGEVVIIFAPSLLRKNILTGLQLVEVDFEIFRGEGRIKCFNLELILANIQINNIIIDKSLQNLVGKSIESSQLKFGKVRVYEGMTALLWKQGQYGIAAYLESFWINQSKKQKFSLFSSYLLSDHISLTENSFQFLYEHYNHLIPKKKYYPFRVDNHVLMNTFEEVWRKFKKSKVVSHGNPPEK